MIRHVFAWKVKAGVDNDRAITLLRDFSNRVDVVRSFEIGGHTGDPGDNGDPWDGVLITDFDDWGSLMTYSNHTAHLDLLRDLLPLLSDRAVVDFERDE